jgi:MiaB-like tRNA modifying enzyme
MKINPPQFIYTETFGCAANQNNTEIMKGIIRQAGLGTVIKANIADMMILNTCIVKGPTEKKIERRILDLQRFEKPIIVAGCMPEVRSKELSKMDNVYLLGTHHYHDILNLIYDIVNNKYKENKYLTKENEIKLCIGKIRQHKTIGITQISEGCLGSCNYCITRLAKGKLFSYPQDKIIENVKKDLDNGCKEIWITSQDNASYGLDIGKRNLPKLLKEILKLEGNFKLRVGMMNPNNVLPIIDELIEVYKDEKMFKFLHIPLQSGSDEILEKMNRYYSVKDFIYIVNRFRKEIPDINIATDIILAYPDEGRQDFVKTYDLIKKIQPDVVNFSKYWAMKGTPAEQEKQIDVNTAIKRAKEFAKMHVEMLMQKNKKWKNQELKVLVDDWKNESYIGRNDTYKQIIIKSRAKNLIGKFIDVKITSTSVNYLVGEILTEEEKTKKKVSKKDKKKK